MVFLIVLSLFSSIPIDLARCSHIVTQASNFITSRPCCIPSRKIRAASKTCEKRKSPAMHALELNVTGLKIQIIKKLFQNDSGLIKIWLAI